MSDINEPFLLASYSIPSKSKNKGAEDQLYASYTTDGRVVVAAQADGVHVLDVTSLRPVVAHSLGPTVSFTCAPLSVSSTSKSKVMYTYAAIDTAPDVPSIERGRTLWRWCDSTPHSQDQIQTGKQATVMSHPITRIISPPGIEGRIIVLSPGIVTVVDAETLGVKKSIEISGAQGTFLQAWPFWRGACDFLYSDSGVPSILFVAHADKELRITALAIDVNDGISPFADCTLPFRYEEIADMSLSSSGCLSVLSLNGVWYAYQLSTMPSTPTTSTLDAQPLAPPFQLTGFSFISDTNGTLSVGKPNKTKTQPSAHQKRTISLIALTSSHVLLAALTPSSSSEFTLLLCDLQYAVVLATQTLSIPSANNNSFIAQLIASPSMSDSHTPSHSQLYLKQNVIFTLNPTTAIENSQTQSPSTSSRASIHVAPLVVPRTSTIAAALGKGEAGRRWIVDSRISASKTLAGETDVHAAKPDEADTTAKKMLQTVGEALEQGRGSAASAAFFAWATPGAQNQNVTEDDNKQFPNLQYALVQELLQVILHIPGFSSQSSRAYTPDIVQFLLQKDAVCSGMVPGGLLIALHSHKDWDSILLALRTVLDLPESDLVQLLHTVVSAHRKSSIPAPTSTDPEAMQVDSAPSNNESTNTSNTPTLSTYLAHLLRTPTSPTPLRLALRKCFHDSDDLVCLLQIIDSWLAQWAGRERRMLPSKQDLRKENGVWVYKGDGEMRKGKQKDKNTSKEWESIPDLQQIISFTEIILDASFVLLLPHAGAQRLIKRIHARIEPEVAFLTLTEGLRGALYPFVRAQAITERSAREKAAAGDSGGGALKKPQVDWRQRRKAAMEQASGAIGIYQVEELVL